LFGEGRDVWVPAQRPAELADPTCGPLAPALILGVIAEHPCPARPAEDVEG
jgi:hypothetical protein